MFCNQCGSPIPEGAEFCPVCGCKAEKGTVGFGRDNIFVGVAREKNRESYLEFGIWILVCLSAVLALLSLVLINGQTAGTISANFRVLWFAVFLFAAGMGVAIALRLRVLAAYAGGIAFFFVLFIYYFYCEGKMAERSLYTVISSGYSIPAVMKVVFVLGLLVSAGFVAVCSVQVFSKFCLNKVTAILCFCAIVFILLMGIVSYAAPYMEVRSYAKKQMEILSGDGEDVSLDEFLPDFQDELRQDYANVKNGFGTVAFLMVCLATAFYTGAFFLGMLGNGKQKFVNVIEDKVAGQAVPSASSFTVNTAGLQKAEAPVLQGIQGIYAGQVFPVQEELVIGSKPDGVHIIIQDAAISPRHCSIRFQASGNCYQVKDLSDRGTYLSNGTRLQRGAYTACARGTVLLLGDGRQQFLLR